MDKWMNTKQAAEHLGYSVLSLVMWRAQGRGPKHKKIHGRSIRYKLSWLDEWIENGGRNGDGQSRHIKRMPIERIRLTKEELSKSD
jgi:predicted DNA-binding transcriptional regulator AlpA